MTEKKRPSVSRAKLADALIEDLLAMSDEEVLAEVMENGGDPAKNAETMRATFEKSLMIANKGRMQAAKAGVKANMPSARRILSSAPAAARQRLHQVLVACPPGIKMTLAARKESELSDADVIGMLEDLEELGLIKNDEGDKGDERGIAGGTPPPEPGVTQPDEIDLEAIAFHLNARVRLRPLDGCEARIIGCDDRAVITVNENSGFRRRRFSIAHELGHWCYHRGQTLACRAEDIRPRDQINPERVADGYAADLILPRYLLQPIAQAHRKLTTKTIKEISQRFQTSWTATAIRLVELRHSPAMLICHGLKGHKWKWFTRGPDVPTKWFPKDQLDAESFAFNVLYGSRLDDAMPRKMGADAWFDRWDADRYEVCEQTFRTGAEEVLTIVTFIDEQMLDE